MGSNESIIHGHMHGDQYRDVEGEEPPTPDQFKTFYPNGMIVRSWPDLGHVAIGVQQYDQETGNPLQSENPGHFTSLWADLDRNGINRLIRDLRRHRERVFGKDE